MGIHAAADTEYTWPWYGKLVGALLPQPPNGTPTATVVTEDTVHLSTAHLPARWTRMDEWYNYQGLANPVINGGGVDFSPRANPVHVLLTMDESTYAEADGSDDVDDDHPISWCHRYDGGRAWYTGMGHTEASFLDADFLKHILGGLEVATGHTPDAACGVVQTETPGDLSGDVPGTLALTIGAPARFGTFLPGVGKTYDASMTANVISTATAASLTVRDPSFTATGHLVNGSYALAQPLHARASNVDVTASRSRRCTATGHRWRCCRTSHRSAMTRSRSTSVSRSGAPRRCTPGRTGRRWSSRSPPARRRQTGRSRRPVANRSADPRSALRPFR